MVVEIRNIEYNFESGYILARLLSNAHGTLLVTVSVPGAPTEPRVSVHT